MASEKQPIAEIIAAIDHIAQRFLNRDDPLRHAAALQLASVFSQEMSRTILDRLFHQLTRTQLFHLLEEELGDPFILDRFRPRRDTVLFTRAYGPERITHILPGNIPDIAVMSLVFGLLVKSKSMAKISSTAPSLVPLFLQALQQVDQGLSESIVLIPDRSEISAIHDAFHWANLIILYGSDQTIDFFRTHISPDKKTITYGTKYSVGIVSREESSRWVADAAARDIALYDQKGCLSPHIYYVEEGVVTPLQFAQWVAEALEKIPPSKGPIHAETASMIQQLRGTIPLTGGTLFASQESVNWTVLYDPDRSFTPSPLSRTIFIKPVRDISEIPSLLEPVQYHLQAVGVAIASARLPPQLDALGRLGVSRICPIGTMQEPPLTWHHDGRFRIVDLLRFVDYEGPEILFSHGDATITP